MIFRPSPSKGIVLSEADVFRDNKQWSAAAEKYRLYLEDNNKSAAIWVQLGHCLKELGDFDAANSAYLEALQIEASDADLYLQLGHLEKLRGNLEVSAKYYVRSHELDPNGPDAKREIEAMRLKGVRIPKGQTSNPLNVASIMPSNALMGTPLTPANFKFDLSIVGKFGLSNGIALHSHAFASALRHEDIRIQAVNTRPRESTISPSIVYGIHETANDQDPAPSLISIYCDVVANSPSDDNHRKVPDSLIKIAYAVFDSSHVPAYWAEILNQFDAVAVPDAFLVEVLQNSGVQRPVFVLPLALDYNHLDEATSHGSQQSSQDEENSDAFTFGCIAGYGERKNIRGLISAFVDAFGPSGDVKLRIHSTLNFSGHYEETLDYIKSHDIENIILTCEELSQKKYARLLKSFDAYINLSKGEGFSITPREAMYLGKPTILSDNTAHRTIVESGLVVGIPTKAYEPARFESLGDLVCGYQCDPDLKAASAAMRKVYRNADRLAGQKPQLKAFAQKYSIEQLREFYKTLTMPKNVFFGNENSLNRTHLVTSDIVLYNKYRLLQKLLASQVNQEDAQRISVVGHDGGFFSVFNTYISHLVWNQGRPEVTSIIPDWRIDRIQKYRGVDKFTSFCYGTKADGNLWLKFCYPLMEVALPEELYNDPEYLENAVMYDDYNEKNEPNLTYIHAYKLYKSDDFKNWRKWYNAFFRKHIRFREHITSQVETFKANNFDSPMIIGCHVRHPSHGIEQPGKSLPTVELYQRMIIERVAGLQDWKVFLATDQDSVVDSFEKLFGDRLIYRQDVNRVSFDHDKAFKQLSTDEQNREGHQIQHIMAADQSKWTTQMGDEVIIDALLLSKCDVFIHVTSNIATAVSYMNPDIEMIYCE